MSRIKLREPGTVYVMSNASMSGLLKIGATTIDPMERAKQLTAATSSPTPFHLVYHRDVPDVNAAEAAMHSALASYRVNDGREFFRVSLFEVARTLDALCAETFSRLDPPTPFADLFATFPDDGEPRELTAAEQAACRELEKHST